MWTALFSILLLFYVFKMLVFSLNAGWGITKVTLAVVVFPLAMVGLVLFELIYVALPILCIAGILTFVIKPST